MSRRVPVRRLVLASIHDVSPRFESEVDRLMDVLHPHVGQRIAMLVVPNHWGNSPIVPGSAFAARLRAWANAGVEMFLHGYFHRDDARHVRPSNRLRARLMTAGEGEFLGLSRDEAQARIRGGLALIEDVTGRRAAGFVAPAWLYGPASLEALADCGVPIAEDHWRVWSPGAGETLARGPVITWAGRSSARLALSVAAAAVLRNSPMGVIRIGVHPPDLRHPRLMRSISAALHSATRTRRPAAYTELLGG